MNNALRAGALYFALVFALGFVLGVLRVLVLAPRLGEPGAVLCELPVILVAAWLICARVVVIARLARDLPARAAMGGFALVLLLAAEFALGLFVFGRPLAAQLAAYGTLAGALGLVGQLAFAAFPILQRRRHPA